MQDVRSVRDIGLSAALRAMRMLREGGSIGIRRSSRKRAHCCTRLHRRSSYRRERITGCSRLHARLRILEPRREYPRRTSRRRCDTGRRRGSKTNKFHGMRIAPTQQSQAVRSTLLAKVGNAVGNIGMGTPSMVAPT